MKSQMADLKVSVLVPAFNEQATIGVVLEKLDKLEFVHQILVIDDGSTDGTRAVAQGVASAKITLLSAKKNRGKTAAIALGLEHADGDIIVIQDADLEYDPEEIGAVIQPIIEGHADVVYGSRFLVRRATRVLYFYHYLANKFLTFVSNLLTNLNMTDIETCYKAFRAPVIKHLTLTSSGFGMEVEITAMISKLPIRIYEVPISYYGRTYAEGKKIGLRDGLMAFWYICYYNLVAARGRRARQYFDAVKRDLDLKRKKK